MLSIRDELLRLAPVDTQRADGSGQVPATDIVREWQHIASGINDIAEGQRKAMAQLESFLASVRSAAAETQRTAAATQSFFEDQRALLTRDRDAHPTDTTSLEPLIARLEEQQRAATAEVQALVQAAGVASIERDRALEIHLRSGRRELEAVVEPLASAALDFREIAVGLSSLLSKVEGLSGTIQANAEAVRAAVSEELLHRHEEMERIRLEVEKSGSTVTNQITAAIASLDQATQRHADLNSAREELKAARQEAEAAREAEKRASADAEQRAEQLRAASTSMMAFLEVMDDLASLPIAEADPSAKRTFGRLTSRAQRVIEAAGLTEITAQGVPFDEELHEPVQRVSADGSDRAGTVVRVVQRGFRNAERVVRRAQVVVAE